jgi:hypothetical protein
MACIRLKGRAVVERLDPSRVAVEDGPDAAERVQAFIERDYRIRSGLCPNGCGLMGPFPDPDNCSHDSKTTTIGPTTDQRNHHCPDCGKLWTTWPTDEERRAALADERGAPTPDALEALRELVADIEASNDVEFTGSLLRVKDALHAAGVKGSGNG